MSYVPRFDNESFQSKIVEYFDLEYGNNMKINYIELSYRKRYYNPNNVQPYLIIINYIYDFNGVGVELCDFAYGDNYNEALVEVISAVCKQIDNESNKEHKPTIFDLMSKPYEEITLKQYNEIIEYYISIEEYTFAAKFKKLKELHYGETNK